MPDGAVYDVVFKRLQKRHITDLKVVKVNPNLCFQVLQNINNSRVL